jgi:SAM-dependent methyltransferase
MEPEASADRAQREREFHNKTFADNTRDSVGKFYAVDGSSNAFYEQFLAAHGADRRVLEYGCGPGSYAFFLAERGAQVTGIDISEVAIEQAAARAQNEALHRCDFQVMNAEALTFAADSFDLVCGTGILHHLDLDKAARELSRTMRPQGRAIFIEPLGHNPLINLYRRMTPQMRTADEHPLRAADLKRFETYFGDVEAHFFHMSSLLAIPLRRMPGFRYAVKALEAVDRTLFRWVPPVRKYAWMVVLVLQQPHK